MLPDNIQRKAFHIVLARIGRGEAFTLGPCFAIAVPNRGFFSNRISTCLTKSGD